MKDEPKVFNTLDDLVVYAGQVVSGEVEFSPITQIGDSYTFELRVDGADWDKRIDIRGAKYILALQEVVNELYNENPNLGDPPRIKVEVKEGSNVVVPDFTEVIKAMVTSMTPQQTFIVAMTTIAAVGGYFFYKRYRDSADKQDEQRTRKEELEVVAEMLDAKEETTRKAVDALHTYAETHRGIFVKAERPAKSLLNSMDENDEVSFRGEVGVQQSEGKQYFPKGEKRTKKQLSYCDGEYELHKMVFSLDALVLELTQDGVPLRAYTENLDDSDTDKLFEDISERLKDEPMPFPIHLQMNVSHTDHAISSGSIVGIGQPRADKDIKVLSELLK